jgi:hypothetical protein
MISFQLEVDNLFVEAQASNPDYSASLDVSSYVGPVYINVACNATGTDTPAITVEHSADDSTFAAIPASALMDPTTGDADTFTTPTASTAQDETLLLNRQQLKRYVRVVLTGAVSSARTFAITAVGQLQYTDA